VPLVRRSQLDPLVGEDLSGGKGILRPPQGSGPSSAGLGFQSGFTGCPEGPRVAAVASAYDPSEFIDPDLQPGRPGLGTGAAVRTGAPRAPSREEVEARVLETQRRLAELRQEQEALERERAALEELRRRQTEFQTGRQEMIQNLTRGIGLLEEAEQEARQQAEQMARTLSAFREALEKIRAIREEHWAQEDLNMELTRALTILENARMEWNSARLKFPLLNQPEAASAPGTGPAQNLDWIARLEHLGWGRLCKLGLALTWPLAVVLLGLGVLWFVVQGLR